MSTLTTCRTTFWGIVTCVVATCLPNPSAGQQSRPPMIRVLSDSTIVQELQLTDGTKLVGHITAVDNDQVAFETLVGLRIDLARRDIVKVREIEGFHHEGQFWEHDGADSRLFVFPTGRVPAHGRGYFGVYELVVPSIGVGIGGVAMVSAGMSIIPGVAVDEQVFYIAPKVQLFDAEYAQGAVGLIWVQPGASNQDAGLAFGTVTAGTDLAALTGGFAVPLYRQEDFDRQVAYFVGGEVRTARNIKLVGESWIFPGEGSAFGLGLRILAGRVVAEIAAVTATETDVVLPLVNITLTW